MMLSFVLYGVFFIIAFVFVLRGIFKQKQIRSREKHNETTTSKKHKSQVSYLEPKINANAENNNESPCDQTRKEPCSDGVRRDDVESADDILGIAIKNTSTDSQHKGNIEPKNGEQASAIHQEDEESVDTEGHSLPEVLVLYLKAPKDKPYGGYELLQALLSSGFRYGKYNIFHFFESNTARSKILYSLSSAIQPGTFDLPKMGGYTTPALCLFFKPREVENPMTIFESILNVVGQLSEDLGGEVLDSSKQRLTKETVREICLQIHRYEQHVNNMDLFIDN